MSAMGDMLEAVHAAPRASTLHVVGCWSEDHEATLAVIERINQSGAAHIGRMRIGAQEEDPVPSGLQETRLELWSGPGGWRVDEGPSRLIASGGKILRAGPEMGGMVSDIGDQPVPFTRFGMCLEPVRWLGWMRFRVSGVEVRAQRPCWRVETQPVTGHPRPRMPWLFPGTVDYELWIDQSTGIALRAEGRFDGEVASQFVVEDIEVDRPIDPAVFAFVTPDGSPTRSQGELQLDRLQRRGVDVSGIDPDDPVAVREAVWANLPLGSPPHDVENMAAQHTPTGPPPEDEEDALIDIGTAFEKMLTPNDDGEELRYVERGENLADSAAEVRRRFPQAVEAGLRVERVKFLHDREAVVWFSSPLVGIREGRAMLINGSWKVSRATYSALIAIAAVGCPPPPHHD